MTKKKKFKLNMGCGETKLKGYINIDIEPKTKPDLLFDIRSGTLPFKPNTIDEIVCFHNIEHIEMRLWPHVFAEFHRVLKKGSKLYLSYPEFEVCAKYFLENYRGKKDFWRATLYGRQSYVGDYHVTPMVTKDFVKFLLDHGFDKIKHAPEYDEVQNTFLECVKGEAILTRVDVLRNEIFKGRK